MKFKRRHTRNGVTHEAGEPFRGDTNTARFLFHRGILEPDGSPDDDAITRNPSPRRQHVWGRGEDLAARPTVKPVHTGGGMYDVGPHRIRGKQAAIARANELNADTGDTWAPPRHKET